MKVNEYKFFDDYEIVDRIELLVASEVAGSKAHSKKIVFSIEELRETQVIE